MTVWNFQNDMGVWMKGTFEKFTDRGGTDVTYWFKDETGRLHLVSGTRLKAAYPEHEKRS